MAQNDEQAPKRTGRPPKPEGERKRLNRTFRVNNYMNERLETAAAGNQRSVSEEIEHRLERSFSDEHLLRAFSGSGIQEQMLRRIADVVRRAREFSIISEKCEKETRRIIHAAVSEVLDIYCWYGQDVPERALIGVHGKPSPRLADRTPDQIGGEIADSAMMLGDDLAMEDFNIRIADCWTGKGSETVWEAPGTEHGNKPGTRPLKEILGGR